MKSSKSFGPSLRARGRMVLLPMLAGAALSVGAAVQSAQAASYHWGLTGGGAWDTVTANWLLNNTGGLTFWPNGANEAVFGGFLTSARTVSVAAGGVTAGGITFTGPGTAFSTVGTSGNTIVLNNGGSDEFINVGSNVLGGSVSAGTGGGNTLTGSPITFAGNLNIANNGVAGLTNLTIASGVNRASAGGAINFSGTGNTHVSGVIGANVGGINKTGSGTLILNNTGNQFSGPVNVTGGVLALVGTNNAVLGAAGNGVNLSGGGVLRFNSGITLSAGRVINVGAGGGGIDLNSGATQVLGAGQLTGSDALRLSITGGTAATLSVEGANNAYSGAVTVGTQGAELVGHILSQRVFGTSNGATLRLQNAGTLANASSLTVNNGAGLAIVQPTTAVTGRLGTATPLTFNSGRFQYTASANGNAAISETMGNVTISGLWALAGSGAAGPTAGTTLNFGNLVRADNATLMLRSATSGSGQIGGAAGANVVQYKFANMADVGGTGTSRNVVPWAGAVSGTTGTDFFNLVTYDANGFRPLAASEASPVTTVATWTGAAGTNADVRAAIAVPGNISFNSMFNSTGTVTLTGSGTVTNTSGAFSNFNTYVINGPSLDFPNGAYFHLGFPLTLQGAGSLSGAGGVTTTALGASSSYQLRFTNTAANPFTGGLFINGNSGVTFTANNQLGNDGLGNAAGAITLGGGQLMYVPTSATTATLSDGANARSISVNASNGTIGAGFAGAVLQVPGLISGPGQLQFGGGTSNSATGVVELTGGANTYSGGTLVSTGVLRVSNPNQLGSGAVLLNGGTLQAGAGLTFASAPVMVASSTLDTQGNSVTLSGGLRGSGGTAGTSTNSMTITKAGAGTLTLAGPSDYAGGVTLGALGGTFTISGAGAAPGLGTVSVGRSAIFNVDDSGTANAQRVGGATGVTLTNNGTTGGATFNVTTNGAGGTSMSFGALTLAGGVAGNVNTSTLNVLDGGSGSNTLTFASLGGLSANNLLNVVGTTNLGLNVPGGTRIFFVNAPSLTGGVVANLTFTGFGGTGQATYDGVLGLIRFDQTTGTFIDNINNVGPGSPTGLTTSFLTNGATTANLGATVKALTVAGHTVTLVPGLYAAQAGNGMAASDTLVLANGSLTTTTAASTITSASASKLRFGSAGDVQANVLVNTGADLTIGANVSPITSGGLLKSGAGAMTIAGGNGITGAYNIAGGTLNLPSGGTIVSSLTGVGGTTLNFGGGVFAVNGGAATTFAGVLAGSTTGLTLASIHTGALTITGTNTFSGPIGVAGGSLVVGGNTALGAVGNAPNVTSGGTLGFTGGITVGSVYSASINGAGAAGSSGAIDNVSGTNSFAGAITLPSNATIGATAGSLTLSGGISGAGAPTFNPTGASTITLSTVALNVGANALTKTGTGTLVLPNLANTMNGMNVSAGLVRASADNNLGAVGGPISLSGGGGLQYGAVFAINAARPITLGAGGGVIDTQSNNVSFGASMGGTGSLTKSGTGTLTLTAAQGYAGATTVRNGTLTLGIAGALPSATDLTLGDATASTTGGLLAMNGFNLSVASLTVVAPSSATTRLSGAGTITVNGPISFVNNSSDPDNDFPVTLGGTGTALDLGGGVRSVNVLANANTNDLVIAMPIGNGGVNYTGSSNISSSAGLQFTGANTFTGGLTVNRGNLNVSSTGTLGGATNPLAILASGAGSTFNSTVTIASAQTIGTLSGGTTSGTATATLAMGSNALTVNQASDAAFNGVLTGSGTLTKAGPGTLTLGGTANTHTGVVNVNVGMLLVNGVIASSTTNAVAVASGATLGGSGTVSRNVNVAGGGFLSPGNSPGILTLGGNLALAANGTLVVELNGPVAGSDYDRVAVNGTVNVTDALFSGTVNYAPSFFDVFFVLTNDGTDAITGTFAGLPEGATVGLGGPWSGTISYVGDSGTGNLSGGNDVVIYNVVPAPAGAALLGMGGLLAARRRRR